MGLFDTVGDILGTNKSGAAIDAQTAGAGAANQTMKEIYDQQRADMEPWRKAGEGALSGMQDKDFQRDFTMADFQADPGYAFRMSEGQKALERSASARGGLNSGATMKALTRFGQDTASQEFGNAYNRFNADRDRRYGRLSTLAGYGMNAAGANSSAAQNYGNTVAGNQIGLGNANAAAQIGDANRNAQMFNGIIGAGGQAAGAAIMACDRRLKTDIEPVSKEDLAELRACIRPFRFRYRNPEKFGQGEFIGPMAQDLEKSKLGKTLVTQDKDGNKVVDVGRAMMLILASWAEEVA